MRYTKGIETDLKILALLATKKEVAQYDMPKLLETTYRTVLRHLQPLEKDVLIKVSRTEPSEKKGKDRKIYTLTMAGLIEILKYTAPYEMIDLVAENYAEMFPLVFGKWSFFEKEGQRDIAIERLKNTILYFQKTVLGKIARDWSREPVLKELESMKTRLPEVERILDIRYDFHTIFLVEPLIRNPIQLPRKEWPEKERKKMEQWFEALSKDPDLKAFLDRVFKQERKDRERWLESFTSWKTWFETLS